MYLFIGTKNQALNKRKDETQGNRRQDMFAMESIAAYKDQRNKENKVEHCNEAQ